MSRERIVKEIIDGWVYEVQPLLVDISLDSKNRSVGFDREPFDNLQQKAKDLDLYLNQVILKQCSEEDLQTIHDGLINIRNICSNKVLDNRTMLDYGEVKKVESEMGSLFLVLKKVPLAEMYAEFGLKLLNTFEDYKKNFQNQFDELLGTNHHKTLSSGFSDQAEIFGNSKSNNTKWFYHLVAAVIGIMFFSYVLPYVEWTICGVSVFGFLAFLKTNHDIVSFIQGVVIRVALISPLLWLAYFHLKNINEDKMLELEYRHKEVMAKSYIHYMNAIENIRWTEKSQEVKEELKNQLLATSIHTLGKDPTELLNKNRVDDFPFEKVIMELIKKIPNK